MRRILWIALAFAASPAAAWDLTTDKEPGSNTPLAYMTQPSASGSPRIIAGLKCRGGDKPDVRMAFFAQGNNTTLPHMLRFSIARGGQMEITPAGGSPYFVSPEINADGNMLEIGDDDTSAIHQISLFLATGRGPIYVTSPNDMKWEFPPDSYTARLFLETCGIISRERDVGRTAERATDAPGVGDALSIPRVDVDQNCNTLVKERHLGGNAANMCIDSEQAGYNSLKLIWALTSTDVKTKCLNQLSKNIKSRNPYIYTNLSNCVTDFTEMEYLNGSRKYPTKKFAP